MTSNRLLIEPEGPQFVKSLTGYCFGRWGEGGGGQSIITGATEGPGHASWAITTCGFFPTLGI